MQHEDHLTFKHGNTTITVTENYEALGRYTVAKEQANHFKDQRHSLLQNLHQQLQHAMIDVNKYPRTEFDVQKARELLDGIDEAQQNMVTAINAANIHADACKKPKLQSFQK